MKNTLIKSLLVGALLSTSAFAYEADTVKVNWIGYKTQAKAGVPGTFDKTTLIIKENADFSKFLASAKVSIDPYSINSKMKFRDNNISSTLFKVANITEINASVIKVSGDDKMGTIDVEINMNNVKKVVPMKYSVEGGVLKAIGTLDILAFSMSESFNAFVAKCNAFHAGKTWTEVSVSFDLAFKK